MLQINSLEKHFGERALFVGATLTVAPGERVALFGRNGSGKSTLLKIIAGEESPDGGDVSVPRGYRIGYLKQHLSFSAPTVIEEACSALQGDPDAERYKAEIVLEGLGFSESDLEAAPAALSGGFQIRINLAKLILSEPNMLLLDEPTNYLDIVSMRWLERYLRDWPGEMIIISHDRDFCDFVSTHSALIYRSGMRKLEGSSEKLFARIAEDEEIYEKTRVNREKEIKKMEAFINRFRAKASKASVVQSRVKALEKVERLEELSDEASLDFSFVYADFPGRFPLEVRDLCFGFTGMSRPLVSGLSIAVGKRDRIGIIGKNGRGKSTLLKLMAGELTPQAGSVSTSPNTRLSYFAQTNTNRLPLSSTIEAEIQATNPTLSRTAVRAICGCMMFEGDDALKKISVLSGGERSRVVLGKILATPSNLLLLDEPTNHLDVESVAALTDALEGFEGAVLVVTHSEEMLRRLATRLIVFQGEAPFIFEGGYDDFLESIGWEDEQRSEPSGSIRRAGKQKGGKGREQQRREEAERRQSHAREVAPLRKAVEQYEVQIATFERRVAELSTELARAAERREPQVIRERTQELNDVKQRLEAALKAWEEASERLLQVERV